MTDSQIKAAALAAKLPRYMHDTRDAREALGRLLANERERCAKIADAGTHPAHSVAYIDASQHIASMIRSGV